MKKILLLPVMLLGSFGLFAQAFTGETGYIYVGDKKGEYSGNIDIKSGIIRKTDILEVYAETGRKFTLRIVSITNADNQPVNEVKAGESNFFVFHTDDNASGGSDYLRNKYKVYPKGFSPAGGGVVNPLTKPATFTATLDGKPFRANVTYKGASFWKKGVKGMIEKPYLQLQFGSILTPDDRLLTIQVFNPKEAPVRYTARDMEVNFSGTTDGNKANTTIYGFVNGKGDTDFTMEITQWKPAGAGKALISGTISGTLREVKILGTSKKFNQFESGSFQNVEVEIFHEQANFDAFKPR